MKTHHVPRSANRNSTNSPHRCDLSSPNQTSHRRYRRHPHNRHLHPLHRQDHADNHTRRPSRSVGINPLYSHHHHHHQAKPTNAFPKTTDPRPPVPHQPQFRRPLHPLRRQRRQSPAPLTTPPAHAARWVEHRSRDPRAAVRDTDCEWNSGARSRGEADSGAGAGVEEGGSGAGGVL